jgi:hypothetical protein
VASASAAAVTFSNQTENSFQPHASSDTLSSPVGSATANLNP